MNTYKSDIHYRQIISHYTPDSYLNPISVFSLIVNTSKDESELTVCFV